MAAIGNDVGTNADGNAGAAALVWKTITIGTYRSVGELRDALRAAHIWIGDVATEALDLPALALAETETEIDLAVIPVEQLGFGASGATLGDIQERAKRRGLVLCPAEVALQLRLQYRRQPVGEFLLVAMEPLAMPDGRHVSFVVGNGGAGLAIIGRRIAADDLIAPLTKLVFALPR
jgi:hypothetical protein